MWSLWAAIKNQVRRARSLIEKQKTETGDIMASPLPIPPLPYNQEYYTGQYSYYANASRMSGGATAAMFPEGWGAEGEKPEDQIYKNAVEGLWLPVWYPDGADGYIGNGYPETILYAANGIKEQFDQEFGPAHSSPEVDAARWQRACELGLEAAGYTSGAPHLVQE